MNNYTVTFNGLTIGAGTLFPITNIEGLGGTSPLRIQDDNRGYLDGSYTGQDFYDERTVYIDVTILGDNSSTAQSNYKILQKAFAPQSIGYYPDPTGYTPAANQLKLFQFRLTGNTGDQQMYGRSRGLSTMIDPDFTYGFIQTRIQLTFPDPRYYDTAGTTKTGASFTVSNSGWATSCPVITVSNPAPTGTIGDGINNMDFTALAGTILLTVDLLQRVVYLDGFPYRNALAASSNGWLSIPANTTSLNWSTSFASMSTTYRNAYI